ncbi:MAG TPA: ATP-dependent 6-phosphofructokinase [Victivallales bacterium]|nr:ATP-dependent 6-phosphofructokinase [Victivallales bacterium]
MNENNKKDDSTEEPVKSKKSAKLTKKENSDDVTSNSEGSCKYISSAGTTDIDFDVKRLGKAKLLSPLSDIENLELKKSYYIRDNKDRVRFDSLVNIKEEPNVISFEKAGPRSKIYHDPNRTKAGIITCGGLCPGLNDVIRSIVKELEIWYKVKKVWGFRFGYQGLAQNPEYPPVLLSPDEVEDIHTRGGTILGSSRGNPPIDEMIQSLEDKGINILFCIGGDGTLKGAHALAEEIEKRGLEISIIGIPKTVDNDIPFVEKSFGFQTAVEEASKALDCVHVEATCTPHGIGIVKLMGRDAGFITAYATRSSGSVDFCLIPEMNFSLAEKGGLYDEVREVLAEKGHAVIAVAEGAGQNIIGIQDSTDDSGNVKFNDIGRYIRDDLGRHFADKWDMKVNIKYISPSYQIRSVPANSQDSIFCADLARFAVDAGMAGKTDMMVGHWKGEFTNVPLSATLNIKRRMRKDHRGWLSVLASTGQPPEWW